MRILRPAEIRAILASHEKAQRLYDEVLAFYGNRLHVSDFGLARRNSSCSLTVMPPHLISADVYLRRDGVRDSATIVHELLHLRLYALGHPYIVAPERWQAFRLASDLAKIRNYFEHAIMLPAFCEAGFLVDDFTGDEFPPTGEILHSITSAESRLGGRILIPYRAANYFRAAVSLKCGLISLDRASDVMSAVLPAAVDDEGRASWIRGIVERQDWMDPKRDFLAFRELLDACGWGPVGPVNGYHVSRVAGELQVDRASPSDATS